MIFYDATNKRAICQEIDRLCDTSDTSYPRLDKTARVNDAMEELIGKVIMADGTWQYDDTNQTDLPRGLGDLQEGQEQQSFTSEYLQITAIDILTLTAGVYRRIKPLHPDDLGGLSPEEYFGVTSGNPRTGFPEFYNLEGDSIRLFPAPSATYCTLTNGLRVWFKRKPVAFTAVSTTAEDTTEPGIPSSYHILLPYKAALPYCAIYKKDRVPFLLSKIEPLEKELIKAYAYRERDRRRIITFKPISYL